MQLAKGVHGTVSYLMRAKGTQGQITDCSHRCNDEANHIFEFLSTSTMQSPIDRLRYCY